MGRHPFDWVRGFVLDFDLHNGRSGNAASTKRYLSQMKEMYHDVAAAESILEKEDPLVYEFYELGAPEKDGDLAFGTSIVYPGKVGDEYFMTKGHFHTILETAEVYYCLSGRGCMLIESPEGDVRLLEMRPGKAVYVPARYAHRSINSGSEKLVAFFVFRGDAGHDYGTIETKGYRKLVLESNGIPRMKDNENWKREGSR